MAKRIFLALLSVILCLPGGGWVHANSDSKGPVLESYTIPDKAAAGDTVPITAKVTDESGVSKVIAYLQGHTTQVIDMNYNIDTGLWNAKYKVKLNDHEGSWSLKLELHDTAGNITTTGVLAEIQISNPRNGDWNRPEIQSVTFNPDPVIVEDPFTIHIKAVDESGVESITAQISDGGTIIPNMIDFTYDSTTDEWIGTFTFPPLTRLTKKGLDIEVRDTVGNIKTHYVEFKPISKFEDNKPPEKPIVDEVKEGDTFVTGQSEPGADIRVYIVYSYGNFQLGFARAGVDGRFAVPVNSLSTGMPLAIEATDLSGYISEVTFVTVKDVTPPPKPIVHEVTDRDIKVTGTAEPWSTIEVKNADQLIGTGTADASGNFSVYTDWIKAGTEVRVTAIDKAGNRSEPTTVVVKDVTPPKEPLVYTVTDKSTEVIGSTESHATIEVKANDTLLGTTVADQNGRFSIPIPLQKAGTELRVTATDQAGNISYAAWVKVQDTTPPEKPRVNQVTDQDTVVTGEAEPGSTVSVSGSNLEKSTIAGADGRFSVDIPLREAGTSITVIVWDQSGNRSPAVSVTVADVTPPEKPVVNEVKDTDTTVTGLVEAYSTVVVKANYTVIGSVTAYYTKDGKISPFTVIIPAQKAGTVLTITTTDRSGNVSPTATVTVVKTRPSGWVEENGQKYYYDPVTFERKTGWYRLGRDWYYFHKTTGAMATGWMYDGTAWYYLNSDGAMQTGWLKSGSTWYYLNGSGAMKTGWLKSGSTWYYLNSSGAMATGWQMVGRTWYYFNSGGAMQTGWLKSGGAWYYLNSSGAMVTGWASISGKWYYFKGNGALQ
ncbi:Ig-like domain-containing protein [Neobacillus sp. WH10]|uniref:Ig-like domain-containing protein n=1 Tax=Neobacillus sp. WH10 TaxID=3047873 RepID=UPI0024C10059|nr:Ig-like domain-containing protein [Neobacillus sp. WH10]WHY77408.1 Ig-like domain-containing protein [Neobacillus sp. WH10]